IAPALIFVAFGIVLGPFGFGVIEAAAHTESFTILAQLALTVILFNQAAMLDLPSVVRRGHLALRLLAIGIPLSIVLGTVVALLVMPVMPLWEAVCLATIVVPTEVALIDALLEDRRIPEAVRHAMSAESGCNDGIALAAMLATVALALVCFEVGERLQGSGFVTAFAGGLAYSMMMNRAGAQIPSQVTDAAGQLLELIVFAMFGSYAVFVGWRDANWRVVVFAVVALIVVRLVAVSAALLGSDLPARSRLFIGWFGPRGIGTLVLGLLMIERGEIEQSAMITQAVVVTVTLSLVVHSLTVPLGVRLWAAPSPTTTAQAKR